MTATDRRYARCLARGAHRYGSETIWRDFIGHRCELRVCRSCHVPETPKFRHLNMGVLRRPRDVILSYRDD